MSLTFLEMCKAACNEIGFTEPSQILGSASAQEKQILALSNRVIKDMVSAAHPKGGWQILHKEHTFNTVNGTAEYALPSDFDFFADKTFYDTTADWEMLGPITPQEKQALTYEITNADPRRKFYVRNDKFYIFPTPEVSGDVIAYDYYSKNAILDTDGTTRKERFANDLDTILLDEETFIFGLKFRLLQAKGLDYQMQVQDYSKSLAEVLARSGGMRVLSLSGGGEDLNLLGINNVPSTGFGV